MAGTQGFRESDGVAHIALRPRLTLIPATTSSSTYGDKTS
jgi:hypothetical protein